jgi:hypothetical protein
MDKIAKYRKEGHEGWWLTDFTMEQVEGLISSLRAELEQVKKDLEREVNYHVQVDILLDIERSEKEKGFAMRDRALELACVNMTETVTDDTPYPATYDDKIVRTPEYWRKKAAEKEEEGK